MALHIQACLPWALRHPAPTQHSSLDLTINVYTDPSLLDVAGALALLPAPSLTGARTG